VEKILTNHSLVKVKTLVNLIFIPHKDNELIILDQKILKNAKFVNIFLPQFLNYACNTFT